MGVHLFDCESSRLCQYMMEHPCVAVIVVRLSETLRLVAVEASSLLLFGPVRKVYNYEVSKRGPLIEIILLY